MRYKRYTASPLRYAGGKSLAVGFVAELLPDQLKRIVCPFMGGGSVEVACSKTLGLEIIAYDIFDILCTYWQIQIDDPKELARRLRQLKPTRETFKEIKTVLKQHWDSEIRLDRYDLATHYYFNANTSYGPHFLGSPSSVYLQEDRYKKLVDKVENFDAGSLRVQCLGFEQSIPRHKNDFLYCDPPYYLNDGKMFVGMYPHRNFPVHHNNFNHELLRDLLLSHKGGFILSYNDCETIRKWYAGCNMTTPKWQYTFGQGDTRIGENRVKSNGGSHIKKSHELLIWRHPNECR
ncbi:MAG: DNA adenine methylase [Candidatus Saccharibacteria bacterium]|nr:DNA adenine methylase [Candidatus Saccharibacteria bacterium]